MGAAFKTPAPTGLYGWIKGNDARSLQLFAGFALAIQLMAASGMLLPLALIDEGHSPIFGPLGYLTRYVPIVFLGTVVVFAAQMFWYTHTVRKVSGFRFVDALDEPRLCSIIEPLIILKGMNPPYVAVIETPQCNAFACGISRRKAVVVVTRGLLDRLTDNELEAVLAHELVHVHNGDIRLMAAVNICMRMARSFKTDDEFKFTVVAALVCVAVPAFFPLILLGGLVAQSGGRGAFASRLAITSTREFIADAEASELTRNPAALASALTKIDGQHRLDHMSRNDDAMMILGEHEGRHASHPGIRERVDALARVTGSMVFNAPDAASRAALGNVESRRLFGRKRTASVLQRARAGVPGGFLGFSRASHYIMLGTVAVFLWLNVADLGNPRAMAAKFDIRAIGIALGMPDPFCTDATDPVCIARKKERNRILQYQDGTLVGVLVRDIAADRAERRYREARGPLYLYPDATAMRPYLGQSGKLADVRAAMSRDGLFAIKGGGATSTPPEDMVVAELDAVGCFQADMFFGEPAGHYPLDYASGDISLARYRSWAQNSVVTSGMPGNNQFRDALLRYLDRREIVLKTAYDMYGLPGLKTLLEDYASPEHALTLDLLREAAKDSTFDSGFTNAEVAKLHSLVRDPARFLPCLAVKAGA